MANLVSWEFTQLPTDVIDILEKDIKEFDPTVKQSGLMGEKIDLQIRNSENSWISTSHWIGGWLWYYVSKTNRENFLYDIVDIDGGSLQYTHYNEGQFYNWHQDGMDNRMLTIIWYLNDIDEDGYTEFYTGLKIQPKMGKILMFPALWPWIHRGYPPKYETKYICTGWIRNISEGEVINRGEQSE